MRTAARSLAELVSLAKAQPGHYQYASAGNGTLNHLLGEMLNSMAGIELQHVPYKGVAPAINDVLGGQLPIVFASMPSALAHIKAGKLRPLAVTTATRSAALPDVPTLAEAGLAGFNIGTWFGVLAPAATPRDVVARLNAEMVKIIKPPEFVKRMDYIGAQPVGNKADEMARQIKEETEKFAALVKAGNVTVE